MGKAKGRGRGKSFAKPAPKATLRRSPRKRDEGIVNSLAGQPANPLSNPFPNPPGNPLALVSDYALDDDFSSQDNHESELSEDDSGLDVYEFPPDAYLELLYKDSVRPRRASVL
jgi:hypothetical protein